MFVIDKPPSMSKWGKSCSDSLKFSSVYVVRKSLQVGSFLNILKNNRSTIFWESFTLHGFDKARLYTAAHTTTAIPAMIIRPQCTLTEHGQGK